VSDASRLPKVVVRPAGRPVTLLDVIHNLREELQRERALTADLQRDGRIRTKIRDQRQDELAAELQREWVRNADLRDRNAVLRGTIGRLEDTIQALLGYTECGCGEDEEGRYGKCVPCHIRDEGIYP
jgi:hypothetical protein